MHRQFPKAPICTTRAIIFCAPGMATNKVTHSRLDDLSHQVLTKVVSNKSVIVSLSFFSLSCQGKGNHHVKPPETLWFAAFDSVKSHHMYPYVKTPWDTSGCIVVLRGQLFHPKTLLFKRLNAAYYTTLIMLAHRSRHRNCHHEIISACSVQISILPLHLWQRHSAKPLFGLDITLSIMS
jgi:hypothetical protein